MGIAGRGRPAKPLEQHRDDGTYRRDRHGHSRTLAVRVSAADALAFGPPAHLNAKQAAAWRDVVEPITDSGMLTEADLPALEMMAVALATFRLADAELKRPVAKGGGLFVASPNGYRIAHPAFAIREKAAGEFRAWAARFGLTPADRASLGLTIGKGRKVASSVEQKIGKSPRGASIIDEPD